MSRTYRNRGYNWWAGNPLVDNFVRKEEVIWEDVDTIRHHCEYGWYIHEYYTVKYGANTKTGKKNVARYRRDRTDRCKEPGPSWFRNLYSQRPLRREGYRELKKYMKSHMTVCVDYEDGSRGLEDGYEPMFLATPPLPYYT